MSTRVLPLVVALLLLGGCVSRTAGPGAKPAETSEPPEPPNREQVLWADSLCSATSQLTAEQARGEDLVTGPPDDFTPYETDHYLTFVADNVSGLADQFGTLVETSVGFDAADRYATSLADALTGIAPEVTRLAQAAGKVKRIVELIGSVKPEGPDLATLVREDPEFATVHDLAPACTPLAPPSSSAPPEPVPSPENGTDIGSCADGTCEVELTGTVEVQVREFLFQVTVDESTVTMTHDFPNGGSGRTTLGVGGEARISSGDTTVVIHLLGIEPGTAVLKFSTE
ncbi:hypothetical protein [Actinophytocola gossypii]|uniref:Uncharacterized protein n=1 Tax=Actinophytocola gossypii TaxID=2812003 RepID=A0ABT2J169_9PSEU|nr:hypothetical protein [Actinophytocola gossypii]MCT2581506.1 hypothetical protein [Actinophytocola gossypii]